MTDFKINDLVIIIKQPNNSHPNSNIHMQGLSGYIEDIKDEYAQFVELREDGCGGCGAVPLSHLKLANDNIELQSFKLAKDEKYNKLLKEGQERTKRYDALLAKYVNITSIETGVNQALIREIFGAYEDFLEDWNENYG